jgi:hypothetical protein
VRQRLHEMGCARKVGESSIVGNYIEVSEALVKQRTQYYGFYKTMIGFLVVYSKVCIHFVPYFRVFI